jgi:hypothetical protein
MRPMMPATTPPITTPVLTPPELVVRSEEEAETDAEAAAARADGVKDTTAYVID